MNKRRSKYWDLQSKNSSSELEDTSNPTSNRKFQHKGNSHGDANLSSHRENASVMRTKKLSKVDKDLCTKLDADYIETLVGKIKELKSRMVYFERQFPVYDCFLKSQKSDCGVDDFEKHRLHRKCDKNVSDSAYEDKQHSRVVNKVANGTKGNFDHQKSIYPSNEQTSVLYPVKNDLTKSSNSRFNKTNVSTVMSMHSSRKDDIPNIERNGKIDSKQFKATAEEFILQAEELKSKITYILNCCGYGSSVSRGIPSTAASELSTSVKSGSQQSMQSGDSKETYPTVESINFQYKEIMKVLASIDKNVKRITSIRFLANALISRVSQQELELKPTDDTSKSSGEKGVNKSSSINSVAFKEEPTKLDKSTHKHKQKSDGGTSKKNIDKLEPVVMVYEPIEPQCEGCKVCCQSMGQCTSNCKNRDHNDSCPMNKSSKKNDGKSQKHGFVVTYTPNINQNSKSSVPSKKKRISKIRCCFGF